AMVIGWSFPRSRRKEAGAVAWLRHYRGKRQRPLLDHFSMTASTSRAESTRYSSPPYLTSVPPYFEHRTVSPTLTSTGLRLPLSPERAGPTARAVPSCGFSLGGSGITSPAAVVV